MIGRRTLVKLDVVGYADIVKIIEEKNNAKVTSLLNNKIQGFVARALDVIGCDTRLILKTEGDSALVCFQDPCQAHKFAVTIHEITKKENVGKPESLKIVFRIGCATGELDLATHDGYLNAIAYRLEVRSEQGGILINRDMFDELPSDLQSQYDIEEVVEGKRLSEIFYARRWRGDNPELNSKILCRILEIPKISNTSIYKFESITLNKKAEIVKREHRESHYLREPLEKEELRMIAIPGGEYKMGSQNTNTPYDFSKPLIKVPTLLVSQHPITKAQWKVVAQWNTINRTLKKITNKKGAMNSPVVSISWHDAVEFCDRLSSRTNSNYRLLTESEWEYVCRAGSSTPFFTGETISATYANYDARISSSREEKGLYRQEVTPVDYFKYPNRFGLFDMHGNVWEWCLDNWNEKYFHLSSDREMWYSELVSRRVIRGGSFRSEPSCCTSNYRQGNDEPAENIGFRIARDLRN
jgi:formylglycine-generating enzyme required for sulfatase activity/class 3 adenylate cyclase